MLALAIDIGNTSTHYGIVNTDDWQVSATHKIDTGALARQLPLAWANNAIDGIAYCSVVPAATEELQSLLQRQSIASVHLNHKHCPGLTINYPKPAEIGQDRLANAIAAQTFYGVPAIVIDMGTAVTFDIITHAGYEGGIIAPGLAVMTRYLHEQTALLPALDANDLLTDGGIGKSTIDAMKLGCAVGFSGMIQALLQCVTQQLEQESPSPSQPTIIGTGGSACKLLKEAVPTIQIEPNMVLLGLAETLRRS